MKRRMQSSIRSRIFHNQVLEAICRAIVWNAISWHTIWYERKTKMAAS